LNSQKIKKYISLSGFTTWRIGGPAEWLAEPTNINELIELINWAKEKRMPCHILGAGSNLLINDKGLTGLSLCMRKLQGAKINKEIGLVEVFGGEPLPHLARRVAKEGLHGLEWAIGIPGTVGGAVAMNAGAQGECTAKVLTSVKVISLSGGEVYEIEKKDLNFSYRHSLIQEEDLVVLSARFLLEPGHDKNKIINITNENLNKRLRTQPYNSPSCGSVFRNPEPLTAGKLIENLGLKGLRIGGAEISEMHANFIINSNNATAHDIQQLISVVQKKVKEKHGFLLHPEVKKLGFETID